MAVLHTLASLFFLVYNDAYFHWSVCKNPPSTSWGFNVTPDMTHTLKKIHTRILVRYMTSLWKITLLPGFNGSCSTCGNTFSTIFSESLYPSSSGKNIVLVWFYHKKWTFVKSDFVSLRLFFMTVLEESFDISESVFNLLLDVNILL